MAANQDRWNAGAARGVELLEPRRLLSGSHDGSEGDFVTQTNLVSDGAVPAQHVDPDLVNPWGIGMGPTTPFWISDNGMSKTTLYDGAGNKQSLIVNIPGGGGQDSAPTGQVFNATNDFVVSSGGHSGPAKFIFAGEDGGISGWNPGVSLNNAVLAVDHSASGAVYKGVTLGSVGTTNYLYAANFHSGDVEVYDGNFAPVHMPGAFHDARIPAGFAPFNVQNVNGRIFVTYAKQDADAHDDVAGAGNGYVDVYDARGRLLRRFDHGAFLDSPWGVTQAPRSWGHLGGDILVGNFGSGKISIFNQGGEFRGFLNGADGKPIVNDGLWALTFGNGASAGDPNTLYFTAGLNHEADGLFGSLTIHHRQHDLGDQDGHDRNDDHGDHGDGHDSD